MSRVQLALNVEDIDEAVAFYSALFRTEPAKRRPGYANFAVAEPPLKLVLLENKGATERLNHLGIEVASTEIVDAEPPHTPRGCPFQAWSVGEALRIDRLLAGSTKPTPRPHPPTASTSSAAPPMFGSTPPLVSTSECEKTQESPVSHRPS